jgi:activator of HSP90 ATPase
MDTNNLAFFATASDRRRWILRTAVAASGFAAGATILRAADDDGGLSHNAGAIHQEVVLKAPPKRVYEVLTDAAQFQKVQLLAGITGLDIAGNPAVIHREAGGSFSLFAGYVIGRQVELVPDQRIVQAWRAGSWQPGAYSIVRFELADQGGTTKLVFDHTGFPAGTGDHLASGWKEHYWEPLQKFLA